MSCRVVAKRRQKKVKKRPYKRKPKSTLTAYEKEPHSDVLDRPVIGMWLFRFLIVCTAVFLVMLYARLSLERTEYDQDTFPLSRQYLQKPDGRVYYERFGEEGRFRTENHYRIGSYQHRR